MHVSIYYIRVKSISTHNKHEVLIILYSQYKNNLPQHGPVQYTQSVLVQGVGTIPFPIVKTDLLKPCTTVLLMVCPFPSKTVNHKLIFHKNR